MRRIRLALPTLHRVLDPLRYPRAALISQKCVSGKDGAGEVALLSRGTLCSSMDESLRAYVAPSRPRSKAKTLSWTPSSFYKGSLVDDKGTPESDLPSPKPRRFSRAWALSSVKTRAASKRLRATKRKHCRKALERFETASREVGEVESAGRVYASTNTQGPSELTQSIYSQGGGALFSSMTRHSNEELANHLSITTLFAKMEETYCSCTRRLAKWLQVPSHRTLRQLERQIELAIRESSIDTYLVLYEAMQKRATEPMVGGSENRSFFMLLHARLCANYGTCCLLNFETRKAGHLLEEAILLVENACTMRRGDAHAKRNKTRPPYHNPPPVVECDRADANSIDFSTTAVLYLRVLLANAFSCERHYWLAAQQYHRALSTIELYPLTELTQVVPGLEWFRPLCASFVWEDAQRFFSDAGRLQAALAEGQAQFLRQQAQRADPAQWMATQLTLARLQRAAKEYKASQQTYEVYLDQLVQQGEEDTHGVMLELGRMLCFEEEKVEAGVVYLESAAELLCTDAMEALDALPSADCLASQKSLPTNKRGKNRGGAPDTDSRVVDPHTQRAAVRAAAALVDTALAHEQNNDGRQSLRCYETALEMLQRGGMRSSSGWILTRYADLLSSFHFADKAIQCYMDAMQLLQECSPKPADAGPRGCEGSGPSGLLPGVQFQQLGARQRAVQLRAADVEAHLAFCLQSCVGDHRRAAQHYTHALQSVPSVTQLGKMAGSAHTTHPPLLFPMSSTMKETASCEEWGMNQDTAHWMLINYVVCCERLGRWEDAVNAQHQLIMLEWASGLDASASYLKLIELVGNLGDVEKKFYLCFILFFSLDKNMPPEFRVQVAYSFVECCYFLSNVSMGSVLLHAIQQVKASNDPSVLVSYALSLEQLPDTERLRLDSLNHMKTDAHTIVRLFRRAAQLLTTQRVVDAADRADPLSSECVAARGINKKSYRNDFELMSLIALSRGAFLFHRHGFATEAEELYSTALAYSDEARVTNSTEYKVELGVLLANYAGLKAVTDHAMAESLYERAIKVCPDCVDIARVVADFFVMTNNYIKGSLHMKRFMGLNTDCIEEMHVRLARLGTGRAWDDLSYGERLEVMEHLLFGLGVPPDSLPPHNTGKEKITEATLNAQLDAWGEFFVDGIRRTRNDEAACLACYVIQVRFHKPRLLNTMYKEAIQHFPQHQALLVNYADFCAQCGYRFLSRKYYARAFVVSRGDSCRTRCYGNYFCSKGLSKGQEVVGEALYRFYLERCPSSSEANMMYASYLSSIMPTPSKTERYFIKGWQLDPNSKLLSTYAFFIWACADTPPAHGNVDIQTQIFDKAEKLFQKAVELDSNNPETLCNLGRFYASRKNRTKEAIEALHKAHQLCPCNAEIARQLALIMEEECARVAGREPFGWNCPAHQGAPRSPRLCALVEACRLAFEKSIELDPAFVPMLERYAMFAVSILRDPVLAAEMWRRIQRLNRT